MSVVALFFLALEMNLFERLMPIIMIKAKKMKDDRKKGFHIITSLSSDTIFVIILVASFLLTLCAFIILLINSKDTFSWLLLFLCILTAFYYMNGVIIYIYVIFKYPDNSGATETYLKQKLKKK